MASGVTFYTGSRWSGRRQRAVSSTMYLCCAAQLEAVSERIPRLEIQREAYIMDVYG